MSHLHRYLQMLQEVEYVVNSATHHDSNRVVFRGSELYDAGTLYCTWREKQRALIKAVCKIIKKNY